MQKYSKKEINKFLIPSIIGFVFFLFPIRYQGTLNIPLGIISENLSNIIKPFAKYMLLVIISISAGLAVLHKFFHFSFIEKHDVLKKNFKINTYYLIVRIIGAYMIYSCVFKIGPAVFWDDSTGQTMLNLLGTLIAWFFAASFLMPFLTNYGLMEYFGTIFSKFTRKLFRLPGRASIDLLASWVGNCNVGVLITISQYKKNMYTAREAILIATCFSAVSLPFCLVVARMLNLQEDFLRFYLIVCLVGLILAAIMCRIPPLSKYSDIFFNENGYKRPDEEIPGNMTRAQYGLQLAIERAKSAPNTLGSLKEGFETLFGIVFTLTPIVMCYGTLVLSLNEYTHFFNVISYPFAQFLRLLGVAEYQAAAPATITGFADMIIPAILGANITAYATRYLIGVLSLVQIIYMSEVGTLIISSDLPINFPQLLLIFLEKTAIAIPIILLIMQIFNVA